MADQFIGTTVAEKYRIDSPVGETAGLYRAVHTLMERDVWIRIRPIGSPTERFFARAKAASQLGHPNLLHVTDFGTDANGTAYVVYEPAEGETLAAAIERDEPMTPANVIEIARQAAAALAAMRSEDITHGDLSPDRIILAEKEDGTATVKVIDFGSANVITADRDVVTAKAADFHYISPEQCAGSDKIDERSDIYSLGVIMFEMLAGEVPFAGEKPTDVMLRHIEEPPPPLSAFRKDLPAELEPIVLKALAKNPDMRYQNVDEILADLEPLASGTVQKTKAKAAGGNFVSTLILSVIGIGLLASALIYATYSKTADPVTQLKPDLNGIPVQPINPATGVEEQNLMAMPASVGGSFDANTMTQPPGTFPGGDGYDPWASGQAPPGAPPQNYVPPGGQVYTIDPNSGSQFMPYEGGGIVLVPVPANTAKPEKAASPTPTPQKPAANTAKGTTPAENQPAPATPKQTPKPAPKPGAAKPSPKPPAGTGSDGEERS